MKSILQKKTSIVGEFIDIQLHKDKLYLWNFEGEVNVVDFEAYIRAANRVKEPLLLNEAILLDKFSTPGTSLPIDTYIMQNNLYFATDDGVYKGYVQNKKEDKFLLSLKPKKIWDARVFTITKKLNSQLLSFASGDNGLYELNLSRLEMVGVKSVEKNIFLINNQPSHFARYSNLNIESFSRGDKFLANFRRETHKRIFEGINKEVDFDINHTTIDGLDFYEASDGLTVYQNGLRILQYDEEFVRWRYFNRGAFNGFLFVLTNEMADIYELLTSGNKDVVAKEVKKHITRTRVIKYCDIVKNVFGDTSRIIDDIDEIHDKLLKLLQDASGCFNCDLIDGDNWDRLEDVRIDKEARILYLSKDNLQFLDDKNIIDAHRMVYGAYDNFQIVFKVDGLSVISLHGYPMVVLKSKESSVDEIITQKKNEGWYVIRTDKTSIGTDFTLKKDGHIFHLRYIEKNLPVLMFVGKDTSWDSTDSIRLLLWEKFNHLKSSNLVLRMFGQKTENDTNQFDMANDIMPKLMENLLKDCLYTESLCYCLSSKISDANYVGIEDTIEDFWHLINSFMDEEVQTLYQSLMKILHNMTKESLLANNSSWCNMMEDNITRIQKRLMESRGYKY